MAAALTPRRPVRLSKPDTRHAPIARCIIPGINDVFWPTLNAPSDVDAKESIKKFVTVRGNCATTFFENLQIFIGDCDPLYKCLGAALVSAEVDHNLLLDAIFVSKYSISATGRTIYNFQLMCGRFPLLLIMGSW